MENSAKYQYLAAFVVNILSMSCGTGGGWTSPNLLLLQSDESPLPSGKITTEEASWVIASLWCVGGLVGNLVFGIVTKQFGRKFPLLSIAIPTIISWLLVLFAQNVYYLYAARVLYGITVSGVFVIVSLILSEISNDSNRGMVGTTMLFSANFGILTGFTMGSYSSYNSTPIFIIVATILFAVFFTFFPDSPTTLIKQNKLEKAEKSIRFYKNIKYSPGDEALFQAEMAKLKNDAKSKQYAMNLFNWQELMTNPGRKALLIGIGLATLNQLCGYVPMSAYTANIFKESGSTLSPNASSIIVTVIQFIGSIVSTALVDRVGRKLLYIESTVGTFVGLISLGAYLMLKSRGIAVDGFSWIPVTSLSFVSFMANWAILSLHLVVISETMPANLKEFGTSICLTIIWSLGFIITKLLPFSNEVLGLHGTMFLFAGVCLISAVLIVLFLPETKGKSHDVIMEILQ